MVKLSTHNEVEQTLNELTSQGWELVTYQTVGEALAILHFLVFSKAE